MPAAPAAPITTPLARADVITCALETGLPADLDLLAEASGPTRNFLRRAWYRGDNRPGLRTLLARRRDGTPVIAIPTRPIGPKLLSARAVSSGYWPFRSFPMAQDATDAEIATLLSCGIVQRAMGSVLRIGPVYDDDPAVARLAAVAQDLGWTRLTRPLGTSFVQDIARQSAEGIWPGKSRHRKMRSYERKLAEQHGSVTLRTISGADWNDSIWSELANIEAASWVGTRTDHSGAKFLNAANMLHWCTAIADPVIAENLRAMILYAGDQPVAFSFDLQAGDILYGIASGYREDMARFSPGQIVTTRLLDDALARGIRVIDWGCGDSGYKRALGAEPGPQIIDMMLVRAPVLAAALKPRWEMTHHSVSRTLAEGVAASLGEISRNSAVRMEHVLLPGLAIAAAAAAMGE